MAASPLHVVHVTASIDSRHGGPSRSVPAIAAAQAALGLEVALATVSLLPAGVAAQHPGLDVHAFPTARGPLGEMLRISPGLADFLGSTCASAIHAHGLWLRPLTHATRAARRLNRPLVISPRGMLSPWAYRHHRWKKWLAERFVHPGAFETASGWHATSREEADDIRRLGFSQPICIAPNGVEIPSGDDLTTARMHWLTCCPAIAGRRVALFYSRFHRKKRVLELIEAWSSLGPRDWFLLIVGTPEEYTPAQLNQSIAQHGLRDSATAFSGEDVPAPYAVASLLLLPSHSENFGLVVAEALAAGLPVVTTDQTPWLGLHDHGAGWCVPWENWPATLAEATAESLDKLEARGARGRTWMANDFTWESAARTLGDFYRSLDHG